MKTEGRFRKAVRKVAQISFSGNYAVKRGQKVLYVTERAVFELTPEGIVLMEVAPGMDPERDILPCMEFMPRISEHLRTMPEALFGPGPVGIFREREAGELPRAESGR